MGLTWSYDSHTEVGLVRRNNQDSAFVSPRMLLVADGMGGAAAGDLASAVAVWELADTDAHLTERIATARAQREAEITTGNDVSPADDTSTDVLTVLASTLGATNDRLIDLVDEDAGLAGMGTTVCGFVLAGDRAAVVNIGDSRAYLIRDGELHRVTHDHSWVQTLVDEGRITEEQALEHPHRSLVLRVLNGSPQHEPDLGWLDIRDGDRLLVCSDGLCGLATDAEIAAVATTGESRQEVIDGLVALAHAAGGHDNITIIIADVETDGPAGVVASIGAAATIIEPSPAERTASYPPIVETTTEAAQERAITENERYALQGRRKASTRIKIALAFLLPMLALGGGGAIWYSYTQTQYFVGPNDANVALFRGVPDELFGWPLSTLLETDSTRIDDLPPYYADRVRANIKVSDLPAARSTLIELRQRAAQCIAQREARELPADPVAPVTPSESAPPVSPDPSETIVPEPDATTSNPARTPAVTPGALPGEGC